MSFYATLDHDITIFGINIVTNSAKAQRKGKIMSLAVVSLCDNVALVNVS
jgi:hypothetical protein